MQKIDSLQPYIDHDLYTVPLNGKVIQRDDKGKKRGFVFPTDWQDKYNNECNTNPTPIGGLLTGREQNLIAIDCDDTLTYNLFRQLDPTNTAYMDSIGKLTKVGEPIEAGTIFYSYTEEAPKSFRVTSNPNHDLDYYNGSGMVFVSTVHNRTKSSWYYITKDNHSTLYNQDKKEIVFNPMPQVVISTLRLLDKADEHDSSIATSNSSNNTGFLAHIIETIDIDTVYIPELTKVLTPKDYRNTKYHKQGHLHPNDIEGSAHMYLFKIMCALASDITIDEDTAELIVVHLNNLRDNPKNEGDLYREIIYYVTLGKAKNSKGEPYWAYDPDWKTKGLIQLDKRDNIIEIFFDDKKDRYYFYNITETDVSYTPTRAKALDRCKGLFYAFKPITLDKHVNIRTVTEPSDMFGHNTDKREFNLFQKTTALTILQEPSQYDQDYNRPEEFINYIEHFIPDEEQRTYLMRLILTKLTTFNYSPVVPYIIGVQGSGKDMLMDIIANIVGVQYIETGVGGSMFLEKYNGWLMDKFFVQLNELADTVTTKAERSQVNGKLKNYTGSQTFQVRLMGVDTFSYKQQAMFIMTANGSPLEIEDTDRRLYYIGTPNTFDHSPQCKGSSPTIVYKKIMSQTEDIAYWLATTFKLLDDVDYVRAPDSKGKAQLKFTTMPPSHKIAWSLKEGEFDLLKELLINCTLFRGTHSIALVDIVDAYTSLVNATKEDAKITMTNVMKQFGHKLKEGIYYYVKGADTVSTDMVDDEAEEIDLKPQGVSRI